MKIADLTLEEYRALVQDLKKSESIDIVDNDTVEHASILVSTLVDDAKDQIRLFTTSFCPEFYLREEVQDAFKQAAKRGVVLNILAQTALDGNTAIPKYREFFGNKLSTHIALDGVKAPGENKAEVELNNFMIIDDHALRYEQETKPTECETLKNVNARGSFNRPLAAKFFSEYFDKVFLER